MGVARSLATVGLSLLLAARAAAAEALPPQQGCDYDIALIDPAATRLRVDFSCAASGPLRLGTFSALTDSHVGTVRSRTGEALRKDGNWIVRSEAGLAQGSYEFFVELPGEDAPTRGLRRVGESVLTSPRALLLLPERGRSPLPLTLRFRSESGGKAITGLPLEAERYRMHTNDLPYTGFMALGKVAAHEIELRDRDKARAQLRVAVLDSPHGLSESEIVSWISESAGHVAAYFGGFPVRDGLVVLRPVPGQSGLLRGMVNGGGGASMLLLIGEQTPARLLRGQWMLMHELVHFSAPFIEDHPWIMEGMAVYVETTLRVRAGWFPEEQAWRGFMRNVPQGVPAMEQKGLAHGRGIGAVYWGGALFWLLADVETRERSGGSQSIADCFRGVLAAGGDTSARWPLERFIAACDAALGAATVRRLYDRYGAKGSPVDLYGLWTRLGVRLTEYEAGVVYDDTAPLAAVRRAIMSAPRAETR
jgi:hypothetical protein